MASERRSSDVTKSHLPAGDARGLSSGRRSGSSSVGKGPLPHHSPKKSHQSITAEADVATWRSTLAEARVQGVMLAFGVPTGYSARLPDEGESPLDVRENEICVFCRTFESGIRFPLLPEIKEILRLFKVALGQYHPNALRYMVASAFVFRRLGISLSGSIFASLFKPSHSFGLVSLSDQYDIFKIPSGNKSWKEKFFFLKAEAGWDIPVAWRREVVLPKASEDVDQGLLARLRVAQAENQDWFDTDRVVSEETLREFGLSPGLRTDLTPSERRLVDEEVELRRRRNIPGHKRPGPEEASTEAGVPARKKKRTASGGGGRRPSKALVLVDASDDAEPSQVIGEEESAEEEDREATPDRVSTSVPQEFRQGRRHILDRRWRAGRTRGAAQWALENSLLARDLMDTRSLGAQENLEAAICHWSRLGASMYAAFRRVQSGATSRTKSPREEPESPPTHLVEEVSRLEAELEAAKGQVEDLQVKLATLHSKADQGPGALSHSEEGVAFEVGGPSDGPVLESCRRQLEEAQRELEAARRVTLPGTKENSELLDEMLGDIGKFPALGEVLERARDKSFRMAAKFILSGYAESGSWNFLDESPIPLHSEVRALVGLPAREDDAPDSEAEFGEDPEEADGVANRP